MFRRFMKHVKQAQYSTEFVTDLEVDSVTNSYFSETLSKFSS